MRSALGIWQRESVRLPIHAKGRHLRTPMRTLSSTGSDTILDASTTVMSGSKNSFSFIGAILNS